MNEVDRKRVLVVDDEENMRLVLRKILASEGFDVLEATDGQQGLAVLDREVVDFVLCDVRMPVLDGPSFLEKMKTRGIQAPVIMLSAYGTVDSALEAIKAGAFDYVFKPFKPDEILLTLKKADEQQRLKNENLALRRAVADKSTTGIIARSKVMSDLLAMVDRVAQVKSPVLITGESGTGKELVARAIHAIGPRSKQAFVAVNCGAIPENLLESELFGHKRGAFTGAVRDRDGLFREADQGTLFLDEIGELSLDMQVKLLRVLQFEEVRPVGASSGSVKVDVRIVAATARDLRREAEDGRFREDLFYRLNVLPLFIPPLRSRPEDVRLLLDYFLTAASARLNRPRPEISAEAGDALVDYNWPGNVRELENLVDRLMVMSAKSILELEDLPERIRVGHTAAPISCGNLDLKAGIKELEARFIREALIQCGGNRSEAARRLNISYPSLLAKIKTYDIDV